MIFLILFFLTGHSRGAFDFDYPKNKDDVRGIWLAPMVSFILPGADQWYEGQYAEGAVFTGLAGAGLYLNEYGRKKVHDARPCLQSESSSPVNYKCNQTPYRLRDLGSQTYLSAGGYSAYYAFQSSMRDRQEKLGEYAFIQKHDSMKDVTLAPFRISFLKRWTSFVPLGLVALALPTGHYRGDDAALAMGNSYNAGTWEEAFFRGYMMPAFNQSLNSPFFSNLGTATIFGAAHYKNDRRLPWQQFLSGMYLGWVTERNEWSIQESIFIHFWYDVVVFVREYADDREDRRLSIFLPLLQTTF